MNMEMMMPQGQMAMEPSMEEQNLLLRRQAQDALLQLRSNQMQQELGAIAKEREAEIAKELNSLDKDAKMPGKQRDENSLNPEILADIAAMRLNAASGY